MEDEEVNETVDAENANEELNNNSSENGENAQEDIIDEQIKKLEDEVSKWKAFARKNEKKAQEASKTLDQRVKDLEGIIESERLQREQIEKTTKLNDVKTKLIEDLKLPIESMHLLTGEDEKALKEQAENLKKLIKPTSTSNTFDVLRGSGNNNSVKKEDIFSALAEELNQK